ncbi:Potassium-transporting ATPase A chain (Potassium-translocating ATPase A chain) (ATP phosphohydrolase [potassium-transporting] A chain) (Potassium-binding and translocating subunit A) [Herminiimonas arsenicoxydans]|uniref:Potassium-transporting ATPase potassium-binding subunit n=1 Tax=Herminiimonas arsenicoxydans TaxID=204773 RepID=KDPA_HERAR|nr:RecName: Full=Potassium-transporting ATPase potassium-binding subunit; AltName: Full=ATP phosphohydrolase [potassium-transporting] A chain; AltName: Full=Potassium-binding and translocating subunit A; AltName: Full=Potassium-translocating ATPase A chain [Herminiimonas arsenicoxydans]CAL61786.1 Potassium-transporting ATPase A chain (Potassium-translocating ATPase A chain) (ATP phosphohydrolase [potassium-transporting] A chain) (Potassium-binding and translocating subunit A) [Herminiimonas arseni
MTSQSIMLLVAFLGVLLALAYPLGLFMAKVGDGTAIRGLGWLLKMENALYRLAGLDTQSAMSWKSYAIALLVFNTLGALFVYAVQRLQAWLPLNPQAFGNVSPDSSFNTAVSFVSNTNWQGYGGESTMSYLTQMLALTGQNFFSAATGIAVAFALIRGFSSRSAKSIGNFWVDLTRSTLYILLPLAIVVSVALMGQGVIQNFSAYQDVALVDPVTYQQAKTTADGQPVVDAEGKPVMETLTAKMQTIAMGPVASQEAIKMLGTNGGGFFNANSAHPYENPTVFSNFIEMLAIFLIPAGLCFTFGRMVGDMRQGWAVLGAMTLIFVVMTSIVMTSEQSAHPAMQALGVDQTTTALQSGGNMEGKETRFGISASALFTAVTTAASCGAVNNMHDSLMPMGGFVPLVLMQFGEVVFGGVGTGLYGMLIFAILSVFIAGLMIGRTPEYLGKKIQSYEMKMASIAILVTPTLVLVGTAIAVLVESGKVGIANPGAHGFSEILYAFTSAANNNGSAFAGLSANTPFYNTMLAIAMWFGRFAMIVPILAIAGSLACKQRLAANAGTMPTHGPLFVALLVGVVVLVGVLNYVPALALGPIVEHLQLFSH